MLVERGDSGLSNAGDLKSLSEESLDKVDCEMERSPWSSSELSSSSMLPEMVLERGWSDLDKLVPGLLALKI